MNTERNTPTKWLTLRDLAAELAISYDTVRRWHSQGRLPRTYRFGSAVRIKRGDVDRWVEQHAEEDTGAAA